MRFVMPTSDSIQCPDVIWRSFHPYHRYLPQRSDPPATSRKQITAMLAGFESAVKVLACQAVDLKVFCQSDEETYRPGVHRQCNI